MSQSTLCDMCKKNPATIHLTDIHNDVKKEAHLCAACAATKNFTVEALKNLPQFLGNVAKLKLAQAQKAQRAAKTNEPDLTCEVCGLTWSGFRAKGRLGCAHDYTAFRERLRALLNDAQGDGARHAGKHPAGAGPEEQEARRRQRAEKVRARERERLEARLRAAVAEERYEDAGHIRDELAALPDAPDAATP